jgi:hypothetical protein
MKKVRAGAAEEDYASAWAEGRDMTMEQLTEYAVEEVE